MEIREGIRVDEAQLAELCRRHEVVELAVFGSVLRDDFRADSDIDVLVTFAPGATPGWGGARRAGARVPPAGTPTRRSSARALTRLGPDAPLWYWW
jgi:hypothetical protein